MKALDLMQDGEKEEKLRVVCLDTEEVLPLTEWARRIGERRGLRPMSVYAYFHRLGRKTGVFNAYGLTWELLAAADSDDE